MHTLTGRIPLWKECLKYWKERPLLGFGYNSFWTPATIVQLSSAVGWSIGIGLSTYMDLALGLGIPGLSLYVFILALGIRKSVIFYRLSGDVGFAFSYSLLIWICIHMLTESFTFSIASFVSLIVLAKFGFTNVCPISKGDFYVSSDGVFRGFY